MTSIKIWKTTQNASGNINVNFTKLPIPHLLSMSSKISAIDNEVKLSVSVAFACQNLGYK